MSGSRTSVISSELCVRSNVLTAPLLSNKLVRTLFHNTAPKLPRSCDFAFPFSFSFSLFEAMSVELSIDPLGTLLLASEVVSDTLPSKMQPELFSLIISFTTACFKSWRPIIRASIVLSATKKIKRYKTVQINEILEH